jgi:thiosulfate dehydrogenase [quinone] large subunit
MRATDREWAYGLLRVAFGVNFAGHGMVRIYHGVGQFAATTAAHLAGAPLPHGLVYGFGLAIHGLRRCLGSL